LETLRKIILFDVKKSILIDKEVKKNDFFYVYFLSTIDFKN